MRGTESSGYNERPHCKKLDSVGKLYGHVNNLELLYLKRYCLSCNKSKSLEFKVY